MISHRSWDLLEAGLRTAGEEPQEENGSPRLWPVLIRTEKGIADLRELRVVFWNCAEQMPEDLCGLLDVPLESTYAKGVRRMRFLSENDQSLRAKYEHELLRERHKQQYMLDKYGTNDPGLVELCNQRIHDLKQRLCRSMQLELPFLS